MRHGIKKVKFKTGKDANEMMLRKLVYNFVTSAHLVTTEARAKHLKSTLDRMVGRTKERTEANKNYLLAMFNNASMVETLFAQVGPAVADITGGYVKLVRLNQRQNDASMMVRVEWAHPVVIDWKKPETKKEKAATAKATKSEAAVEKPEKKVTKTAKAKKATS
ncbi:MAG: bL17 family ribosomal protein [Weeksellaceae bacterium]